MNENETNAGIPDKNEIRWYACPHCRSESVRRDAITRWDKDTQAWTIVSVLDSAYCEACGNDDILPIEYGMKTQPSDPVATTPARRESADASAPARGSQAAMISAELLRLHGSAGVAPRVAVQICAGDEAAGNRGLNHTSRDVRRLRKLGIESIKVGTRWVVPISEIAAWCAGERPLAHA